MGFEGVGGRLSWLSRFVKFVKQIAVLSLFCFFFCYQVIVSEGHFTQRYLVLGDRLLPGRSGWPTKFDIFSY